MLMGIEASGKVFAAMDSFVHCFILLLKNNFGAKAM